MMSVALFKFLITQVVPRLPFLSRLAIAHSVGLLETSSKWDLRTTLIVRFLRSFLDNGKPTTISYQQKVSLRDPGIVGPLWVSSITIPKLQNDDNVLAVLLQAVDARKEKAAKYDVPSVESIYAEWTGYRQHANSKTPHPKELSDAVRYKKLMTDTKSDTTILYFHGGALYLMDVASHRPVCSDLSRITGGRCLNVRYRLAPKFPFPAAVLDCFTAYLYLLYPPPGSLHEPVEASKIVFAGDSAGGNLSLALLQLLLQLHRSVNPGQTPKVRFHGREVDVPLPGGVAGASPWLDLTSTMPSVTTNSKFDYLTIHSGVSTHERFPPCALWPIDPRREDLYCDGTMLMHPFASPLATSLEDWKGSPPVFLCYGGEILTDEGKYLARKLVKAGIPVEWEEFEAMPHCFAMLLKGSKESKLGMSLWGDFIARVTKGETIETRGTYYRAKTLEQGSVNITELGELTDKEVWDRMSEGVRIREGFITTANAKSSDLKAKL